MSPETLLAIFSPPLEGTEAPAKPGRGRPRSKVADTNTQGRFNDVAIPDPDGEIERLILIVLDPTTRQIISNVTAAKRELSKHLPEVIVPTRFVIGHSFTAEVSVTTTEGHEVKGGLRNRRTYKGQVTEA